MFHFVMKFYLIGKRLFGNSAPQAAVRRQKTINRSPRWRVLGQDVFFSPDFITFLRHHIAQIENQ